MKEIVYSFQYCDCIYESAFYTMSLHRTSKGAELAMEFHKEKARKEFEALYSDLEDQSLMEGIEFGQMEAWRVVELNIED